MLPRTFSRALRSSTLANTVQSCSVCTCRCGTAFRSHEPSQLQRRPASTLRGRSAPGTWKKKARLESYALTPEQRKAKRETEEYDSLWLWTMVSKVVQDLNPDTAVDFIVAFVSLASAARGRNHVDLDKYKELVEEMGMREDHVMLLARMLMQNRKEENRALGKKLLFTLSATGHEEATIRILNHAILAEKTMKGTLRSSEILYARGHLREIARKGESCRAMVLEGKIAYELGDQEYAIQLWTQATSLAVQAAEAERAVEDRLGFEALRSMRRATETDLSELSSPWIELTLIHYERCLQLYQRGQITAALAEKEKARAAIEIGCAQDDPTSHYHAAEVLKETDENGQTIHTSSWLYNITKAAASGHVRAAHTLAEYYASSGWKYIEDEPPDHIKPTPFDSYPAPSSAAAPSGLMSSIKQSLGLSKPPQKKPSNDLFYTATFPSTPISRWRLAIEWLKISMSWCYAPSFLLAAKMNLQTNLWSQAQAPASALKLSAERYTYASKEDYEAGRPIRQPSEEHPDNDIPKIAATEDAKVFLREIFRCAEAHRLRDQTLARMRSRMSRRRSAVADEDDFDDGLLPQNVPWEIKKYLHFQEIREQYEHEVWDMEKEAKEICDAEGFDILDQDGGLIYKCRLSGNGTSGDNAKVAAVGGG